jgi:hypothetical protein
MRYFIGQKDIDWSDDRWLRKGGRGEAPERRDGYIGLFDRNIGDFIWFKIVEQCVTRYGYIVERDEPVTGYWEKVILPEEVHA